MTVTKGAMGKKTTTKKTTSKDSKPTEEIKKALEPMTIENPFTGYRAVVPIALGLQVERMYTLQKDYEHAMERIDTHHSSTITAKDRKLPGKFATEMDKLRTQILIADKQVYKNFID